MTFSRQSQATSQGPGEGEELLEGLGSGLWVLPSPSALTRDGVRELKAIASRSAPAPHP